MKNTTVKLGVFGLLAFVIHALSTNASESNDSIEMFLNALQKKIQESKENQEFKENQDTEANQQDTEDHEDTASDSMESKNTPMDVERRETKNFSPEIKQNKDDTSMSHFSDAQKFLKTVYNKEIQGYKTFLDLMNDRHTEEAKVFAAITKKYIQGMKMDNAQLDANDYSAVMEEFIRHMKKKREDETRIKAAQELLQNIGLIKNKIQDLCSKAKNATLTSDDINQNKQFIIEYEKIRGILGRFHIEDIAQEDLNDLISFVTKAGTDVDLNIMLTLYNMKKLRS